jgi:Xaa-Pro dipeptidase
MEYVPRDELAGRIGALQSRLAASGLDAMLIMQNVDLFYFTGTVQNGLLFVPQSGESLFMVRKSVARARIESPLSEIIPLETYKQVPGILRDHRHRPDGTFAMELDVVPAILHERIKTVLADAEIADGSRIVREVRAKKSDYEIDMMRRAAGQLAVGFDHLRTAIHEGMREIDICAELEAVLRREGHQGLVRARRWNMELWYGSIAAGESASYPISFEGPVGVTGLYPAVPQMGGERRVARGEPVVIDIVGGHGGYLVDKTRIYSIGDPGRRMREMYEFILDLQIRIEEDLRPGGIPSGIYEQAIQLVAETPYAENFMGCGENRVGFIGHGVGLEVDELPVLAPGFDAPLEVGMTLAIEPKIFYPGTGGVGIEDTYVITDTGCEKLTSYPSEMIIIPG